MPVKPVIRVAQGQLWRWPDGLTAITGQAVQASPAPTTTTFAGPGTLSASDDVYNNRPVKFTGGTAANIGQARRILDYVGADRQLVVTPALPATPVAGDTFAILRKSDDADWWPVCTLFGNGNSRQLRTKTSAAPWVQQNDADVVPAGHTITVKSISVWVSLGYGLDANGVFDATGSCIDAYGFFFHRFTRNGSVEPGYGDEGDLAPASGLVVHATPSPLLVNLLVTPWPANHAGVIHAANLWQHVSQPLTMSYYRSMHFDFIPPGYSLQVAAGEKWQIEARLGAPPTPSVGVGLEFDVVIRGEDSWT